MDDAKLQSTRLSIIQDKVIFVGFFNVSIWKPGKQDIKQRLSILTDQNKFTENCTEEIASIRFGSTESFKKISEKNSSIHRPIELISASDFHVALSTFSDKKS